jgi:hypothetical protein
MIRESEGSFTTEIGEMGRIDVASFGDFEVSVDEVM